MWKITAVKGRCQWTQQRAGSDCICLLWWVNYFKKGHGLTFIQKNYINRVWHHENWTWLFGGDLKRSHSFELCVLGSRCFSAWLDTSVDGGTLPVFCSWWTSGGTELWRSEDLDCVNIQTHRQDFRNVLCNHLVILSKACLCVCFLQMRFNPIDCWLFSLL